LSGSERKGGRGPMTKGISGNLCGRGGLDVLFCGGNDDSTKSASMKNKKK